MSEHKGNATAVAKSSDIVIGGGKHGGPHRNLHLKLVGLTVVALAVLAGAIGGGVAFYHRHQSPVVSSTDALVVSGFGKTLSVSKQSYQALTEQANSAGVRTTKEVHDGIVKAYTYKLVAEHLNIAPTDTEVSDAAIAYGGVDDSGKLSDWQRLNGYVLATDNTIHLKTTGGYAASLLYYPYDHLFAYSNGPKPDRFGEASAIADNKAYAYKTAVANHDALAKGTATVDAVMTKLRADQQLQFAGASNDSYSFTVDKQGTQYLAGSNTTSSISPDTLAALQSLKKPGLTPVAQEIESYPSGTLAPGYSTQTDAAYYFLVLSKIFDAQPNFKSQFQQTMQQVKVVTQ